jgi:hypothetical protein
MFTVKHVQSGIENLYVAEGVTHRFNGMGNGVELLRSDGSRVFFSGELVPPGSGSTSETIIYVMNENGKTVATYRLQETAAATPLRNAA